MDEGDRLEHVLDVSMSPVVALDLGNGGDVAGTEGCGFAGENNEEQTEDQERTAPAHSEACHGADSRGIRDVSKRGDRSVGVMKIWVGRKCDSTTRRDSSALVCWSGA